MQSWNIHRLPKVIAGKPFLSVLDSLGLQGKALLLCSDRYLKNGIVSEIEDQLSQLELTVHAQSINNPDILQIKDIVDIYKSQAFDVIIGLGGGSIIDTAKTLSLLLCKSGGLHVLDSLTNGENPEIIKGIPCLAIPTTSGTGAEVTQFATIWDLEKRRKYSLESFFMQPQTVILDPVLTLSLPYQQTMFTTLDALSHAVESLWNRCYNPPAISCAKEAIFLISENLPLVLQDLEDIEGRAKLQTASFLAGIAISHTKTAIAHAISYPLTYTYDVPHGLACSFTILQIYNYLRQQNCLSTDILASLSRATTLLSSLEISKYLHRYLSQEELRSLLPEMENPQRFKNFILDVNPEALAQIVMDSY